VDAIDHSNGPPPALLALSTILSLIAPRFVFGFEASLLEPLHHFSIPRPFDAFLLRLLKRFGSQVVTALALRFLFFHCELVLTHPPVVAYANHLPTDFHIRRIRLDSETIVRDFVGDDGLGEGADDGQLIAEVFIQRLEPRAFLRRPRPWRRWRCCRYRY
jgi:hypothetical protein